MLKSIYVFDYTIELLSGLHIGGSSDVFDIGGADSTVIKNPLNNQPYIPGSSIKGKLRSMLTNKYGILDDKASQLQKETFYKIFGGNDTLSRAVFRDALLTEESLKKLESHLGKGVYTEIKAENKIDPLKGTAEHPRFIERIPAGVELEGQIVIQAYDGDSMADFENMINTAVSLLENNYLGGSGTRGYGRVLVKNREYKEVSI